MTTLAERRAWMRAGCPVPEDSEPSVPEPTPVPLNRCEMFTVAVKQHTGQLLVKCVGCEFWRVFGLMSVEGDTHPVVGVQVVTSSACEWMSWHAQEDGMSEIDAREAFILWEGRGLVSHHSRMTEWAAWLMRGHHIGKDWFGRPGMIAHPDYPQRGIYLMTGPALESE